jgi:hypothetical protein
VSGYLVELTIAGKSIDEQAISRRVGLEATRFFKKGEEKSPGRVWKQSVWSHEVLPPVGDEWLSLDDGLMFLLRKLIPAKNALRRIAAECEVAISCGHFYSSFGGETILSPGTIELLAEFGLQLSISSYFGDENVAPG